MSLYPKIPLNVLEDVARIIHEVVYPDSPTWVDGEATGEQRLCRALSERILVKIFDSPGEYSTTERRILELAVDRMGWDEIHAFNHELNRGQDVREDAGGYIMRAIRRLFGLGTNMETVENYKSATLKLIERVYE